VMSGKASLIDCTFRGNVAKLVSSSASFDASGGAVAVGAGGTLELFSAQMHSNEAGGRGLYETTGSFKPTSDANINARAAHIDCAGTVIVADSRISSAPGAGQTGITGINAELLAYSASAFITVSNAGAIRFRDCTFQSTIADAVLLRLIGSKSQSVIRGCTAANLTVEVSEDGAGLSTETRFAAVNSTFEPPLNSTSLRTAVRPPQCSVVVATERVCDARSTCQPRDSGGVECACVGDGLRDRPGTEPDGRLCTQATGIDMLALTRTIVVNLQKPSNNSDMHVVVQAKGERTVRLHYDVTMTRINATLHKHSAWNWSRLDEQQLEFHGHHLIWAAPPSSDVDWIYLDAEAQKFSGSTDLSFKLRLDCDGAQACVKDGDTVETVIAVGSPESGLDPSNVKPEVRIVTHVQSLVSCRHTRARIEPTFTQIRVRVVAYDVDNLPVAFTRAEIHLVLSDNSIPLQWSRGSNEYTADVPTELTAQPGVYDLVVSVTNAWNETAGQATSCELLRHTITVEEGLSSTSWIVVGAGTAAVAIVGGLALIVRKRHAHLQAILAMLFTEVTAIQMLLGTPLLPSHSFTFPISCRFGQTAQAAPHFSAD
jgi:hypothetical protein